MLIDTHCHLASSNLGDTAESLISLANQNGIDRMITIGTDLDDSAQNIALSEVHDGVFATVGIHPTSVHEIENPNYLEKLADWFAHSKVVGIGEIGLDYFHAPRDGSSIEKWRALQKKFFIEQLELAEKLEAPVVIHQRESFDDVATILDQFSGRVRCVIHCFSGNLKEAEIFISQGHIVSFTGIVTYPKSLDIQGAAAGIAADKFMVETDAPYLAPVPQRGRKNQPAYVRHTAEFIAELRGVSLEKLASDTTETAEAFFAFE